MVQTQDPIQKALEYMRYQGSKSIEDLSALIRRTEASWSEAIEGMSEQQAEFRPGEEWCAKEVLGHLIGTNRGINQQIADMAGAQSPKQAQRVKGMGEIPKEYEQMDIARLRTEVADVFGEIEELMSSLAGNEKLDQQFPHPLFGPLNLKEWFVFHRVHAMDHVQQLDKIKADPAYPAAS
jgi:hypothetical protein